VNNQRICRVHCLIHQQHHLGILVYGPTRYRWGRSDFYRPHTARSSNKLWMVNGEPLNLWQWKCWLRCVPFSSMVPAATASCPCFSNLVSLFLIPNTFRAAQIWKTNGLVASLLCRIHVKPLRFFSRDDDGFVTETTLRSLLSTGTTVYCHQQWKTVGDRTIAEDCRYCYY